MWSLYCVLCRICIIYAFIYIFDRVDITCVLPFEHESNLNMIGVSYELVDVSFSVLLTDSLPF